MLRNNGEWRVGNDLNEPTSGCRVLTGRQASSTFSSLNVSYVNSPLWATVDGTMNVPVILVTPGQEFMSIKGILTYSFSNMKLLPRNNSDLVDSTTSIGSILNQELRVYPNPIKDEVVINNTTNENLSYELVNNLGQVIKSGIILPSKNKMNLNCQTGLYHFVVKDRNGNIRSRHRILID
jgi:hypothetical protein